MFSLPDLPYEYDALEPHLDARTMKIHYTKHHQGYVDKLNAAIKKYDDLAKKDIAELLGNLNQLPTEIQTPVRNNGGGHVNHSLFWPTLSPSGGGSPAGDLISALKTRFGSFGDFQAEFSAAASTQFGSGWAWLVIDEDGDLQVYATPNQDSPYLEDEAPLMGLDVWEHAYYLHYQNRRADYVQAFWKLVDWDEVARRFKAAQ